MGIKKWLGSPADLRFLRESIISSLQQDSKTAVSICMSTGCLASGAKDVREALANELKKQNLNERVELKQTGCVGFCEQGPRVTFQPQGICYFKVRPGDVQEIVTKTIGEKGIVERLLYKDQNTGKRIQKLEDIPFYKYQFRLLLDNNAKSDPGKIEDYIALGGYSALAKTLSELTPAQVIEEVKQANLRGRGGGGFPTWLKWQSTRLSPGEPKYVIVNCDEGDPGAFMDRTLMEANPHSILEGLMIGAYAIGASKGFVFVREVYPVAVQNMQTAIKQAEEYGLIGEKVLGTDFSFRVEIHRGAGAFVSGESSALVSAIEGNVGEPRPKYIHMAEKGINDKPSCLNNVKTWANVPVIILKGSEWFRSIGTKGSSGTAIFSLVGKINNTGLVEVPMGITLRDLIFKIGGGIRGGKKFKAVQTGGPSGGFIPEKYLDLPVDFDELTKIGSMMGSGGMIVMDEDTCIVDVARYFVHFLLDESCGKCIPCREGLRVLSKIMDGICEGTGEKEDIETIKEITETMKYASLCQLGKSAVNPILTSLRYYPEEWAQHIREKRCEAKACQAMIDYYIDPAKCRSCMLCARECPTGAVQGDKNITIWIDQEKCIKCGTCYEFCNFGAVTKISGEPIPSLVTREIEPRLSQNRKEDVQ